MICQGEMIYYFTKDFTKYNLTQLQKSDYFICKKCGFVASKTIFEMDKSQWEALNSEYHGDYLKGSPIMQDDANWQSRLKRQADEIDFLVRQNQIQKGNWVDWGCGGGDLADHLRHKGLEINKYDAYVNYMTHEQLLSKKYEFVISTSVLEHIRDLSPYDEMVKLLSDNGVLGVHTLVREEIPQNPDWFYLLPVHCAFYSNQSMKILFHRYGFKSSLYHPESRLWFWFKNNRDELKDKFQGYFYKDDFMDYWKFTKEQL